MSDEPGKAMAEVMRAGNLFKARLVAGRLESEGIPVHIPGASTIEALDGAATIWTNGVSVQVPVERLEEARAVLAEWTPPEDPEEAEGSED
jgi:hypothetical protein